MRRELLQRLVNGELLVGLRDECEETTGILRIVRTGRDVEGVDRRILVHRDIRIDHRELHEAV